MKKKTIWINLSLLSVTAIVSSAIAISCEKPTETETKLQIKEKELAAINKEVAKLNKTVTLSNKYSDLQPKNIKGFMAVYNMFDTKNVDPEGNDGKILNSKLSKGFKLILNKFYASKSYGDSTFKVYYQLEYGSSSLSIAIEVKGLIKNIDERKNFSQELISSVNKTIETPSGIYRPKDVTTTDILSSIVKTSLYAKNGKNGALFSQKPDVKDIEVVFENIVAPVENGITELTFDIVLNANNYKEKSIKGLKLINLQPNTDKELEAAKELIVHYMPADGNIDGWGLHLWNASSDSAIEKGTEWTKPVYFESTIGADGYYVAKVPIINIGNGLNFIVHKGDIKNSPDDLEFPRNKFQAEFWILAGKSTIYTEAPDQTFVPRSIERTSVEKIQIQFNKSEGYETGKISLINKVTGLSLPADKFSEKIINDQESLAKNKGVMIEITLDSSIGLDQNFSVKYDDNLLGDVSNSSTMMNSTELAYNGELGATLNADGSVVARIWAPTVANASINIYNKDDQSKLLKTIEVPHMEGNKTVFEITLNKANTGIENLDGYFYQYVLDGRTVLDPYAKSMAAFDPGGDDTVGKGAFVDMSSSKAGELSAARGIDALDGQQNKMVAYEVHVRDFTINTDAEDKGTFKGFANWKKGIDHLKDLGITHVQLMPIQNYFTVNENNRAFVASKESSELSKDYRPNYNWGYDPHSYFAIEGWLSSDASDPYARISELRLLIKTLHDANIGVIADVVYNHVYNNRILNDIVNNVYFRKPGGSQPVGAPAVASENPMTRKLILDSIKFMYNEFGIDGFRFDLLGFIDTETVKLIREALPKAILYGEAWNFTDLPSGKSPVIRVTNVEDHKITDLGYFNDSIRRSIKGDTGDKQAMDLGYINGNTDIAWLVRTGIIAGLQNFPQSKEGKGDLYSNIASGSDRWAANPNEAIQYNSIHDGFTLWDKINISTAKLGNGATEQEEFDYKIELMKQSFAMLFASQGRIVIHGGDEMGRTKPLSYGDANPDRIGKSDNAIQLPDVNPVEGKYLENSYNAADSANMFRWNRLDKTYQNGKFKELSDYVKGLIKIRKELPMLRFETAQDVYDNLRFFGETAASGVLSGPYKNFNDEKLDQFTIKFINAPESARGKTWYIAGELVKGHANQNLDLSVTIDADGNGSVVIPRAKIDLALTQLGSWGDDDLINLKLVDREKSWASIDTAFAEQGNGGISAASIDEHKEVKYDLSKLNYRTQIDGYVAPVDGMIQYRITNPDLAGKYSEIIVASNPFMEDKNLSIELSKDWVVIVDGVATDIEGIAGYDYSVNKIATVKKHTMMIFARKPLSSDPQVVAYENAKNLINETLPLVSKTTSHKELEDKINKINANITQLTDTTQSEELKTLAKPIQDKYDQLKTAYDNRIKAVVTLKYLPKSGDATDWGLHLWSPAIDNVFEGKEKQLKQWDKPILFEKNKDADGYYVINIGLLDLNPADPIEFIIHKGDDKSFPENIPLPTITGDKTLYVVQDSKTVFDSKPTQAQIDAIWAPKAVVSTATIKFKPTDGDINGWGIHVWDKTMVDLPGMNDWANPLPFSTAADANGYYEFKLPLYDGSKKLEFIIHKADIKLGNGSVHLPVTASDTTYWVNGQQTTDGGYFFNSMSEADKTLNDIAHLNTQVELPTVDVADKNRLASSVTKEEIVLSKNKLEDAVTFKISDPIVQKDNVSIKVTIEYKYESQRKSKEYIIKGFKTQSQLDLDKLTTEIEKPTVTVVEENKNQLFSTVKEDQIVFTPNNIDADISHKIVSKVKGPSETELKVTIEYSLNEQKLTKEYTIDGFKTQAQLDLVLLNTEADKPTVSVEEKNKNQTFSTVKDEQIVIAKNEINESVTLEITSKAQGDTETQLKVTVTYTLNGQSVTRQYVIDGFKTQAQLDLDQLNIEADKPMVSVEEKNKNQLFSTVNDEQIVITKNAINESVTLEITSKAQGDTDTQLKVTVTYTLNGQSVTRQYVIDGFKTQAQLDLIKLTSEIEKPTVTVEDKHKNQLFSEVEDDQIVFTPNNIDASVLHKIVSKVQGATESELKVTIEYTLNEQKLTKEYSIQGFKTQTETDNLVLLNTEADKPTVSVEEKNKNQLFSTVNNEQIVITKNAMNESVTYKITSKVQGATETQLKVTITYTLNEQSVTREYVIDGFKTQAQLDLIKLNTEIQKISVNVSDENKNQSFSTVSDGQIIITKNDLDPNVTYAIIAKTQGVDEATLKVILEFSFNGQKVTKNYEITGFKTQAEIDSLIQAYIDANKTGYTLPEAVSTKYASDVNASVTEPTYADDGIILASNITTNIQYEFNDTTGTQKATITIKYSGKYETVVTLEKTGYKTTSATLAQIANETSEAQKSRDDKEVRSVYYTKVDKLVATIKTLPESMVESEMAKIKSLTDFKELYKKYKNHIVMKFKPKDPSQIDKFGVHVWTDGNGQDIILPDDKNVDYANSRKFSSTPDADGFYSLIVRSKGLGTFKFIIHKNENGNDIKNGTEQNGVKVPKFVSLEPKNAESKTLWYIESYTPAGDENYYSLPAEDINTNFVDYYVANAINFLEDTKTTGASATTYFQGLAEQFNLMSDANKATHRELFNETLLKFALKFKNDFLYNGNKVAAIKFKPNNDDMLNWKIYVFATGYNDTNIGNLIDIPLPAGYGYGNSLSFGSTKDENGYYTLVLPLKSNTNEIKFIIHRDNNGTDVKNGNNNDKAIQKDLSENRAFYVNDGDADVKWTLV